jgi:polar amino acid transport system substrate-binding protein
MHFSRRSFLGGLAAAAGLPQAAASGPGLRILTTHLPPYVVEHDGVAPGALHELVQAIVARAGVDARIVFDPWKRAVHETGTLAGTAVFPLTRTADRERAFQWLAELYREEFVFLALRKGRFDWRAPLGMTGMRIGILRGSGQIPVLRAMGYRRIVETSSIQESMRFLEGGMVDALIGERAIFHSFVRGRSHVDAFVTSDPVRTTTTWLGGSLDLSPEVAGRLAKARAGLVEDGSYARILKKYGLPP